MVRSVQTTNNPQFNPKGVQDFIIELEVYNGNVYDISPLVTELSIYESIFNSFLYGEAVIVDNSEMLATYPIIGQERFRVRWLRDDEPVEKEFFVIGVFDVAQRNNATGTFGLNLTSEKQMRNSVSLFSKSYRGRGDEIISSVYKEFLDVEIEVDIESKTAHSLVFPYLKPLAAVDMVRKNILAEDNTPFFVYEKFYDDSNRESTVLSSYGTMYEKEPIRTIRPQVSGNVDERGQIYSFKLVKGYDTLTQLSKGAFASSTITVDPTSNKVEIYDFTYRKHAPAIANDGMSTFYGFDPSDYHRGLGAGELVHQLYETNLVYTLKNEYSFTNSDTSQRADGVPPPNLNSLNPLDRSIINSYLTRLQTNTAVFVHMDSVAYDNTIEGRGFGVGETVDVEFPRFSPKLDDGEDALDRVNSGKYIVSAVRHYIKANEYTMAIELIRDGIGEEAQLYANSSDSIVDREPREREQIYEPTNE